MSRSKDGTLIAVGGGNNYGKGLAAGLNNEEEAPIVKLFNFPVLANNKPRSYRGHSLAVKDLAFLSSDQYLVSCGADSSIMVWKIKDTNI